MLDIQRINSVIIRKNCFDECLFEKVFFSDIEKIKLLSESFYRCNHINSFVIDNSREATISEACFSGLNELKSISFNSKIISIENNFVDKCPSLINISITSNNNLDVTAETFKNCNSVKNIKLNTQSKLSLNNNSFKEMNHLETIELSFQSIGDHQKLFENCFKLQTITIKSGEDISFTNDFFTGCTSLKILQLSCISPSQLIEKSSNILIDGNEFSNRNQLTEENITTNISNQIPTIAFDNKSFFNLRNLEQIIITGGNLTICKYFFKNCPFLQNIFCIGMYDVVIDEQQFNTTNALNEINIISKSIIDLKPECFKNSKKIRKVSFTSNEAKLGNNCFQNSSLSSIDFVNVKLKLGSSVFSKCNKLSEIKILASEIEIDEGCFEEIKITKIEINCIKLAKSTLIPFSQRKKSINIPGEIITIGPKCFRNCSILESVSFSPLNTLRLNESAFYGCSNLKELKIDSFNEFVAGKDCFRGCNQLSKFEISGEKVTIEESCFQNCISIQEVSINSKYEIKLIEKAFNECTNLSTLTLESNKISIFRECFLNNSNLKKIDINCKEINIGQEAFSKAKNLLNIYIDSTNVYFDQYCFYKSTSLQKVKVQSANQITTYNTSFDENYESNIFEFNIKPQIIQIIPQNNSVSYNYFGRI